jgi:large subunit ribosomal protein L18
MGSKLSKKQLRMKRKFRIRKKLSGTPERPRLSVFRSAKHIYAQLVDDLAGSTICEASTLSKDFNDPAAKESKVAAANVVGKIIAERAQAKGIKSVVFDRNGFLYHGRIKAVSDGAREAGLEF